MLQQCIPYAAQCIDCGIMQTRTEFCNKESTCTEGSFCFHGSGLNGKQSFIESLKVNKRFPEASNNLHSFWTILLFTFGVLKGRVAGIDADIIARSSPSRSDSRDVSLRRSAEIEASYTN